MAGLPVARALGGSRRPCLKNLGGRSRRDTATRSCRSSSRGRPPGGSQLSYIFQKRVSMNPCMKNPGVLLCRYGRSRCLGCFGSSRSTGGRPVCGERDRRVVWGAGGRRSGQSGRGHAVAIYCCIFCHATFADYTLRAIDFLSKVGRIGPKSSPLIRCLGTFLKYVGN